jgi:hypothetical protein
MWRLQAAALLAVWSFCPLFVSRALAHPASGIVVNQKGEVFFIYTGRGVCKIDLEGKLTYIHSDTGGHWMAQDAEARFSTQFPRLFQRITPEGVQPALLFASGGGPLVVNRDGNLYYGSGFPGGDDTAPGFHTVTRLTPDGRRTLFAPELKKRLADLNEGVMGLANGPDGSLFVAGPNAILKVKTDGTVTTLVHPVVVKDCDDDLAKSSHTRAFHSPYLRGLDVADDGTIYAAVTGCRCVVKITRDGKLETMLKAEKPWTPTGVTVRGKDIYVLEYVHSAKHEDWAPRVRKLEPDGKVTTLANLKRNDN